MAESKENLAREVQVLEERLKEAREKLGKAGEKLPEPKELLRQVVSERIKEAEHRPPSPVPHAPPPTAPPSHDEVEEVKGFVGVAFDQGIPAAVGLLRKSGNAHLLDAFHDVLVDKFYEELVRSGKIKP